jgi:hypothetical protein
MRKPVTTGRVKETQLAPSSDEKTMRGAAMRLTVGIKLASWAGKHSLSPSGRRRAYQVKADKVSHALTKLDRFFCVVGVETHGPQWSLILVRLADRSVVHIPWQRLTPEAQARVNIFARCRCRPARERVPEHPPVAASAAAAANYQKIPVETKFVAEATRIVAGTI